MFDVSEHFEDLLDTSPDAIVVANTSGTLLYVNKQVSTLFGHAKNDLIGGPIEALLPERLRQSHGHQAYYSRSPQVKPLGITQELYGLRKDGTEFPVEVNLSPLESNEGRVVSISIRDITNRRMAATALNNAKEDAEQANDAKTRFLAAASHDLRQPLQSLSIYLDVLHRLISSDPLKAKEVVEKMTKSVRTMGELLDTLLNVSKLDAGTIEPDYSEFPVQLIFDQLMSDGEPLASEQGLQLTIEPTKLHVRSDQSLLLSIMENLVGNALRYTEQGTVTVRAVQTKIGVRLDVSDTGIGIPESALETIFEEYTQLDNPVRERHKGLGLGLNLVKRSAKLLNCPLEVSSTPGVGSVFSILIAEADVGHSDPDEIAPPMTVKQTLTSVLYVEDDPEILESMTLFFELAGFSVVTKTTGSEAIDLIRSGFRPELLVSDYQLPGASGLEVGRAAREVNPEIPLVFITGNTTNRMDSLVGLGNAQVFHKPIEPAKLVDEIRVMLEGSLKGSVAKN